jgi:hypothetical protein
MDGPDETNGAEDFGEDSASVAPAGWEEQDGEEFAGSRWSSWCISAVANGYATTVSMLPLTFVTMNGDCIATIL